MSEEFYITLPSHSNRREFPDNQANHFKERLPHPVRVEGTGWRVGLFSISLPDAKVSVSPLVKSDGDNIIVLFNYTWIRDNQTKKDDYTYGQANFDTRDLKRVFSNVDGVGFMKSMVTFFEQRRLYNYDGPKYGAKYISADGKRMYIKFKWEGNDLVTDNEDTYFHNTHPPSLKINKTLAFKMGWIDERDMFGPNLRQEFFGAGIPTLARYDVTTSDGEPRFWVIKDGFLHLSILCNWRFMNLNQAFQVVVGTSSRSLFVYSDVSGSSVVGYQVTDLLREVNYRRMGQGIQYFEPLHIQYIPLRKEVMDIIETQVSETTGELVRFGEGDTILTLHFKRT